jgi:hypothetical protein
LDETPDALEVVGELPEQISVHLDRGYDSRSTSEKLKGRSLGQISSRAEAVSWHPTKALGSRANHDGSLSQSRRMSKDYERLCQSSQAMISAVMNRLMVRRFARV